MKLLDKAFNKALQLAPPIVELATALKACAETLAELTQYTAALIRTQIYQQQVLEHLHTQQQLIIRSMTERKLDTSLPMLKEDVIDGKNKPN
jgi:hypothetical protein